jgi:hypothetical protein
MENETIRAMIGLPYTWPKDGQSRKYVCWYFCREVYKILGLQLPRSHTRLKRLTEPVLPCIVLFRAIDRWHSGVVWPDGLHFIHACGPNIFDPEPVECIIRLDRLTSWPFNNIIDGFWNAKNLIKDNAENKT